MQTYLLLLMPMLLLCAPFFIDVHADSSPYLYVSAESQTFENHFAGSMVVEVRVFDPDLTSTSEPLGMPYVTVDGNRLQMVQSSSGDWYAYFANAQSAMTADQIAFDSGIEGQGLDFGVLCGSGTDAGVFGLSFSDTEGFFIPRYAGIEGFTNGLSSASECTGSGGASGSENINNVVRKPPRINENSAVPTGQVGLMADAWPVVQLYSLSNDVTINYESSIGTQRVELQYDDIPGISSAVDRDMHPLGAEVFVFVSDMQLNQDPTDKDSWTFNVDSSPMVFYQAFDDSGNDGGANGGAGLVDLAPFLGRLGFADNGFMEIDLGNVLELKPNKIQPSEHVSDGTDTFDSIITIVEDQDSSGMFVNYGSDKISNLGVPDSALRNRAGYIQYNDDTVTVFVGSSTASISSSTLPVDVMIEDLKPGTKSRVILFDADQNINTSLRDDLLISRDTAFIPTIVVGSPLTLEDAKDIRLYGSSDDPTILGKPVPSSVPDPFSARLYLDTPKVTNQVFEKMSLNLGFSADSLNTLFAVLSSGESGSGWLNFDLRSFEQLGITDFSQTRISLHFGSLLDPNPIDVVSPGDLSSPRQLLLLDPSIIEQLSSRSGQVFAVIDFGSSAHGRINNELSSQPIVMDFFSFGSTRSDVISNSVYRLELKEDPNEQGRFTGSVGYVVMDRAGLGAEMIADVIIPFDDEVVVVASASNSQIIINYHDLASVTATILSSGFNTMTHSGQVSYSSSLRFGSTVTIQLDDPDLNISGDKIDVYRVIDDPTSSSVDTVGGVSGNILLEVKIKDIRYQRCVVNGVAHGGLASTGFVLTETGASTGVFEGTFKMPSLICDETRSKLISPGGGSIDVIYYDARDSSGNQNIFSLKRQGSLSMSPTLSTDSVHLTDSNPISEVVLSGSVGGSDGVGGLLNIKVTNPDRTVTDVQLQTTANGSYRSVITITTSSLPGQYVMDISYKGLDIQTLTLDVTSEVIPDWAHEKSLKWLLGAAPVGEFVDVLLHMIAMGLIDAPDKQTLVPVVPNWVKTTAGLWVGGDISDAEFIQSIQYLIDNEIIRV